MTTNSKKVVVIGGGTGTSVVLSGLKKIKNIDLSAIVSVADSGGSTGRLRDEFGFQPVGDLRQSLAALAEEEDQRWIRKLLLYRFSHGNGLQGHNLGNLILTALQDMTDSTKQSMEIAEQIFNLKGEIIPVTKQNVDLVVEYKDGTFIIGEHHLNPENVGGKKIKDIRLSPRARMDKKAKEAIINSDLIILGPGDLYASILPNLIVSGTKSVFQKSKAKIVYIVNLMTRYTQTHNYKASDHVNEIERYLGKFPDHVIVNNGSIPKKVLSSYKKEKELPVEDDLDNSKFKVIRRDLISVAKTKKEKSDKIKRSLLRHNEEQLTKTILKILR